MSNQSESPAAALADERTAPISVAIIEDHREFRDYLTALISGTEGFECVGSFRSVEDALPKVNAHVPDVILLDIGLPGMNGHEVGRQLRAMVETKDSLLIAQTGWGQDEDRRRSTEAGFDFHFVNSY